MFCAANATALSPDAQTLLIVMASVLVGSPANMAACLAGAWPTEAWSTFPIYISVILETGTLDFSSADLMATAASLGAGTVVKEPLNCNFVSNSIAQGRRCTDHIMRTFAVGVLDALRI